MCERRLSLYIFWTWRQPKMCENRRLRQQMTSLLNKDNFLENSQYLYHVAHSISYQIGYVI
jgi:hypothetical protein